MMSTTPFPPARKRAAMRSVLAATALLVCQAALANDRPYDQLRTAVAEDDDQVWSFESWVQKLGSVRSFSVEPEYTFDPANSLQMELTRHVDRQGTDTGHAAEVEYKHLFNRLSREGWGAGVSLSVGAERLRSSDLTVKTLAFKLPISLDLGQLTSGQSTGTLMHLNVGLHKANSEPRQWDRAVGLEQALFKRSVLFAELAMQGDERSGQIGLRHWVKREKLVLDIAWQQRRIATERSAGWIAGIGWYDL